MYITKSGCLGVVRLRLVLGRGGVDDVVPPDVARVVPGDVLPGATDHHDLLDQVADLGHGLVDRGLEGGRRTAAVAAVGGDDHARLAVDDA
ncbi:MAG: hypothetical protein V9G04_00460 [Nocardioides sp.]